VSSLLGPVQLDPLTVADDPTWLQRVTEETNPPSYLAQGLHGLYA
jgi:hypothetical protein